MKILWLSNKVLSLQDRGGTGTWLDAMAQGLNGTGSVQLGNISTGNVSKVIRQDCGAISQWVVPVATKLGHTGLPSKKNSFRHHSSCRRIFSGFSTHLGD